ncbi:Proteasome subunit beta type-5 [Heterocephalus glaber]|uniref:Proteasome subunit beta type-5 n=1 Tax=Heterocephalus glaber TaxID=10181 RepID=G5BAB6_HETGA|nr:Proteasome subunit beta type-5 [Heterocephalus glaber]
MALASMLERSLPMKLHGVFRLRGHADILDLGLRSLSDELSLAVLSWGVPGELRIKIFHGTTTQGFKLHHRVIVAVDSQATVGAYISTYTAKKMIEINPYLLGTMTGGTTDCSFGQLVNVESVSFEIRKASQ